jgi:hypothetical protein
MGKLFGVSVVTILIVVLAYFIGVKYPGPGSSLLGKVGL